MGAAVSQWATEDLETAIVAEGSCAAQMRSSQSGNAMIYVVHALEGVAPAYERVSEYFVLEGASDRGLWLSRRRLVELFRACGLTPSPGEQIPPFTRGFAQGATPRRDSHDSATSRFASGPPRAGAIAAARRGRFQPRPSGAGRSALDSPRAAESRAGEPSRRRATGRYATEGRRDPGGLFRGH